MVGDASVALVGGRMASVPTRCVDSPDKSYGAGQAICDGRMVYAFGNHGEPLLPWSGAVVALRFATIEKEGTGRSD